MGPRPQRNQALVGVGLGLLLLALVVLMESRKLGELEERRSLERRRRVDLEERLAVRNQQLDGALERITEIKGGQPTSTDDE